MFMTFISPSERSNCFAFAISLLFTASNKTDGFVVVDVLHGKASKPLINDKYVLGVCFFHSASFLDLSALSFSDKTAADAAAAAAADCPPAVFCVKGDATCEEAALISVSSQLTRNHHPRSQ